MRTAALVLLLVGCGQPGGTDAGMVRRDGGGSDAGPEVDGGPVEEVPTIGEALDCGRRGVAGGLGAGMDLQRYNFDPGMFPDALCNDGKPAFFYFRPYEGAENASRWVIQIQGGGSCSSGESCFDRWCSVGTNFGMQGMSADASPERGIRGRGILDRTRSDNPLGGFNQVFVRYCSSDAWRGMNRDVVVTAPHPVTGEDVTARLFFEGGNIIDAVLRTLRQDGVDAPVYRLGGANDPLPDLDDATAVVFAGASGGGAGVIWNADHVGEVLRAHNTACSGATCPLQYRVLIDSIFSPDHALLGYEMTAACTDLGLCTYEAATMAFGEQISALYAPREEASCVEYHTAHGELYRCGDGGHVIRNHVTTPMFVRTSQYDSLLMSKHLEAMYSVDGALLDEATYARLIREQGLALTDPANAEEGDQMSVAPGFFSPTCENHEILSESDQVFDVTIDLGDGPISMMQAINRWIGGASPVAIIAPDASANVCP